MKISIKNKNIAVCCRRRWQFEKLLELMSQEGWQFHTGSIIAPFKFRNAWRGDGTCILFDGDKVHFMNRYDIRDLYLDDYMEYDRFMRDYVSEGSVTDDPERISLAGLMIINIPCIALGELTNWLYENTLCIHASGHSLRQTPMVGGKVYLDIDPFDRVRVHDMPTTDQHNRKVMQYEDFKDQYMRPGDPERDKVKIRNLAIFNLNQTRFEHIMAWLLNNSDCDIDGIPHWRALKDRFLEIDRRGLIRTATYQEWLDIDTEVMTYEEFVYQYDIYLSDTKETSEDKIKEPESTKGEIDAVYNQRTMSFAEELTHLINEYFEDSRAEVPDYILSDYMTKCLEALKSVNTLARQQESTTDNDPHDTIKWFLDTFGTTLYTDSGIYTCLPFWFKNTDNSYELLSEDVVENEVKKEGVKRLSSIGEHADFYRKSVREFLTNKSD